MGVEGRIESVGFGSICSLSEDALACLGLQKS